MKDSKMQDVNEGYYRLKVSTFFGIGQDLLMPLAYISLLLVAFKWLLGLGFSSLPFIAAVGVLLMLSVAVSLMVILFGIWVVNIKALASTPTHKLNEEYSMNGRG